MIIIMSNKCDDAQIKKVMNLVEEKGLKTNLSNGTTNCIIGCIGDTSALDSDAILRVDGVEKILKVQ